MSGVDTPALFLYTKVECCRGLCRDDIPEIMVLMALAKQGQAEKAAPAEIEE